MSAATNLHRRIRRYPSRPIAAGMTVNHARHRLGELEEQGMRRDLALVELTELDFCCRILADRAARRAERQS